MLINETKYEIKAINKIKIFAEYCNNCPYKIKITYNQNDVIFGIGEQPEKEGYPLYYYVFAKIIGDKLTLNKVKLR